MNDGSNWPLADFITYTCYGTRLHGDPRGSVDRHHNELGMPRLELNKIRFAFETGLLKGPPVILTDSQRQVCDASICEVCDYKGWGLHARNVRTNHAHIVVSAPSAPEPVMNTFKSWATRRMREAAVISSVVQPWSRHGSTRYLWDEEDVAIAIHCVLERQNESRDDLYEEDPLPCVQNEPSRDR